MLPGAGAFEAACAARLAQQAEAREARSHRRGGELPVSELLRCEVRARARARVRVRP